MLVRVSSLGYRMPPPLHDFLRCPWGRRGIGVAGLGCAWAAGATCTACARSGCGAPALLPALSFNPVALPLPPSLPPCAATPSSPLSASPGTAPTSRRCGPLLGGGATSLRASSTCSRRVCAALHPLAVGCAVLLPGAAAAAAAAAAAGCPSRPPAACAPLAPRLPSPPSPVPLNPPPPPTLIARVLQVGESLGYHGLGLGALTRQVLGFQPPKDRKVTMSNWEARHLSAKQVCTPPRHASPVCTPAPLPPPPPPGRACAAAVQPTLNVCCAVLCCGA